ncbi:hypothetical protein [Shimia sediminis]|uniref:hypothetical protein n=1 Tax=Shimia sediminis TaxID=2497945 RepID=UPI000F8D5AFB|nr:hypothetical protein [Shimia sediminis]
MYEFKVVPAPSRGKRAKGVKGAEGRFAFALEEVMNELAAEGWEFLRSETLPSEEKSGLTSTTTTFRSVMVFRRARKDDISAFRPRLLERPAYKELPRPVEAMPPPPQEENEDEPPPETSFAEETGEEQPTSLPVALMTRARSVAPGTKPDADEDETGHAAE